jgi:hypothetical protein
MAAPAQPVTARQKERRQRMIAAVGGAILLILLIIQVPKTLKRLNEKPSKPSQPATQAAPIPSAAPASAQASSSSLVNLDITPAPTPGQLVTFSRFESKDPFAQQISNKAAAPVSSGTSSPTSASTAPATPSTPAAPPAVTTTPASNPTPQAASAVTTPPARVLSVTSAPISVNGVPETVEVGTLFPKREKIFRLVSVTATTATISIAGGSLESGATTVTLTLGRTLTLMNKANGRRYALRLLSIS